MKDEHSSMEFFRQMFGGSWITQGIWVAAELGIADLLADGSRTSDELAKKTNTSSAALYRVLRALASVGIFAEDEQRRFSLTPLAELLQTDIPGSQRSLAIMMGGEFYAAWGELLHSVRTGEPGFQKRFGVPFFHYMTENPERHGVYDAAMTGVHGGETEPMLDAYDFSAFRTVVDIGGGNGLVLAAVLKRHPAVQGILFDLPAVADRARYTISGMGVSDRMRIEGGDFFSSVPAGADVYVLRHIIHDWEDPEAVAILRQCREAAAPGGRILVVETVLPPGNEPSFGKWLDLMMLLVAGRERTKEEYSRLFSAAGLEMTRVIPTASEVSIIEGVRAT
ncbi:MAG: acetylserotonin O-methyltransferase [Nitrospirota bacterium]|nr:acetylserotonin O-methyltransferase [Nitrospirota bacterium]